MGWLDGRVALITGGASGLGAAVAERFLAEGAQIAVLDKSPEKISELTTRLGKGVCATQGDVRELKDHQRAVSAAVEKFGRLDIFIGNAAIWDYGA
ncbi:MAG: SDR family NAD(P)-dependent oxidoreductase, partial [Rhodoferax sp.]|nr:SDR family NAD(P)-dependent oxidoreductase [Rhodoferax sp.]